MIGLRQAKSTIYKILWIDFFRCSKANFDEYKCLYSSYFKNIDTFKSFVKIHHLDGTYVDEEYTVIQFSNNIIFQHRIGCLS